MFNENSQILNDLVSNIELQKIAKELIHNGYDLNEKDYEGNSLLYMLS